MGGGTRRWLGWPLWLVTVLLIVSAVTGTAGPIQVIWLLGTLSVAASMVYMSLSGRQRSGQTDHRRPAESHTAQPPDDSRGSPAGPAGGTGSGPSHG